MVFVWRTILLGRCWPADPLVLPPPWMNTSTGRSCARRRRDVFGRQTSSRRQSSLSTCGPLDDASCAHGRERRVASSGVLHGATGAGAAHRRPPTGGAADGIPRKASTPSDRKTVV